MISNDYLLLMMKNYSSLISQALDDIEQETNKQSDNMARFKQVAYLRINAFNNFLGQSPLGSHAEQTTILSNALKVLGKKDHEYKGLSLRLDKILLPLQTPPPENFPANYHLTFGSTLANNIDTTTQSIEAEHAIETGNPQEKGFMYYLYDAWEKFKSLFSCGRNEP